MELDRTILEEIEKLGSNPHLRKGSHWFFAVHLILKILSILCHAQEAFAFFGAVFNVGTNFQFLDGRPAYLEQLKNGEKCGKSATEQ